MCRVMKPSVLYSVVNDHVDESLTVVNTGVRKHVILDHVLHAKSLYKYNVIVVKKHEIF